MFTRTFKRVKIKGKADFAVRELYLREDVSCNSPLCDSCALDKGSKTMKLDSDANHYVLPCLDIFENYLDILECQELKGIIIIQSLLLRVMNSLGHRFSNRILNICKDVQRGNAIFLNEVCYKTHVPRELGDSLQEWLIQCCVKSAEFYIEHLKRHIPIILLSENVEVFETILKNEAIHVMSLKQYLQTMWKECTSLLELYDSINSSLSFGSIKDLSQSYENYLPSKVLEVGLKTGKFFQGYLRVNKHNASQEAFVSVSKVFSKDHEDIFIYGMIARNRAIHGDEVVIEMYPENQWKSRCISLVDDSCNETEKDFAAAAVIPSGKVVGILERCWRNYVATLPDDDEDCNQPSRKERILVVPYDYCIPKIRIVTKQAESLRNQRIIVRIDSWDKDSQYPNGHFVQTLGEIGNLETEIQSLLFEHGIFVREFPQNVIKELPTCTDENLWQLEEKEIAKRKDLRNSHLIFSIDPKGCEDVDDALSVRDLPNGKLELGVHIADVTYFVQPLSAADLEAKSRSTSVYLPDRRYDMLPHILSGNLCSLLGCVSRYAVSVIWTLDSNCKVENVWYGRTIINSSYKLCYEVAQDILDNASVQQVINDMPEFNRLSQNEINSRFEELKNSLSKLHYITNILRRDRLNAGGLELSTINMKFEIDKMLPSVVSDIKSGKELAIHKAVAECMIFANHWVAKKIYDVFPHYSVLRRHPTPKEADLTELQKLADSQGFSLDIQSNRDLATSLEKAIDKNDPTINQVLRILATKAMSPAKYFCTSYYGVDEFYHYGLGLDKYTHFTSPIRRYADIMVHRLLLAAVDEESLHMNYNFEEIEKLCHDMNIKHKASQDLEKDAKYLFLSFFIEELSSKENPSLCLVDGIIYSLLTNGVLVFIPKYGIKGAVYLRNKDKKVAVVKDVVEWLDGDLDVSSSSLTVKAADITQKYSIFDHVTLCMKILKSRYHQSKIVVDLVKHSPYVSDLIDSPVETVEDVSELKHEKPKQEFNLYLFLENIKTLCIADE